MNKRTNQTSQPMIESKSATLERLQEGGQAMNKEDVQTTQMMLLNIPQVAKSLGLSRAKVYMLIANEGLPVVRFGRAVRVSPASLKQWIQQREQSLIA